MGHRAVISVIPRPAPIRVFAVDDTSVQLTWRSLNPGGLRFRGDLTEQHHDLDRERARAGATTLTGLHPGRVHRLVVDGDAVARPVDLTIRTVEALPGEPGARVATISDLHLGTRSFGHMGTITETDADVPHPDRCARAAIDEATRWGAQNLVVKGDLTEAGQVHQWRAYAELLADTEIPVDALPGNHDRATGPGHHGLQPEAAAELYGFSLASPVLVRDLAHLRLVLIDSTRSGRHGGAVEHLADDVLDAVTDLKRQGNVIVMAHHQIDPRRRSEGWPPGVDRHEAGRFLRRLAAEHPRVLVTAGHTHRHRRRTLAGATSTQVGSTKDYPGVWAGYTAHEGGLRQIVRRVERQDCLSWTEQTRRAVLGGWRWISPGRRDHRCFTLIGGAGASAP